MSLLTSIPGWSAKELSVLEALATKVRMLTRAQVARGWWAGNQNSTRVATRHLSRLEAAGLIERASIDAAPLLPLCGPVCIWDVQKPSPDARDVARSLISRWREPSEPTTIFVATKHLANVFGSFGGGLRDALSGTHDLHLSEVYLHFIKHHPRDANDWRGEDVFRKAGFGVKDPDALVLDKSGEVRKIVEFGGRYDHRRVAEFHQHCADRGLPYELW